MDVIKQLREIQDLDVAIRDLEEEKKEILDDLAARRRRIKETGREIEEEKQRYQRERVEAKELELKIAEKRNRIDKYQTQLLSIKNNKEYQALLHEIEGEKADIRMVEDNLLELMEEAEAEEKKLNVSRAELSAAEEELKEIEKRDDVRCREIDEKIAEIKNQRDVRASSLDSDLYLRYRALFDQKKELAVARVIGGACRGCNMQLTPQALNDLNKPDLVTQCEFCGRFIYLPEEAEE